MRPIALTLVALAFAATSVKGQSVRGTVSSAADGSPVHGANVRLVDSAQRTVVGVTTDERGRYELTAGVGGYTLIASFVGFVTQEHPVTLGDRRVELDIRLQPAVVPLEGVEVAAGRVQEQEDVRTSLFQLDPLEAVELAGGSENVLRLLQALPGVLGTDDYRSQFVVRGGGPDQNLIYLDGIEIFNPFQLNGLTSTFNPAVIGGMDLHTGAFPARYGDRLSSVLSVSMREGDASERFSGRAHLGSTMASLTAEGGIPSLKTSWIVSGRRTLFDLFDGTLIRSFNLTHRIDRPKFSDLQAKAVMRPAPGHRVEAAVLYGRDTQDLITGAESGQDIAETATAARDVYRTSAVGLRWSYTPTATLATLVYANWYGNTGDNRFTGSLQPQGECTYMREGVLDCVPPVLGPGSARISYNQQFGIDKYTAGARLNWEVGRHVVEAGAGMDWLDTGFDILLDLDEQAELLLDALVDSPYWLGALAESRDVDEGVSRWHAFAQNRVELVPDRLYLQPGLRFDHYGASGKSYLSPRVGASLAINPITTARVGAGRYRQSPGYEKLITENGVFDLSRFESLTDLVPETATHYVAGVDRWLTDKWLIRLEAYQKDFEDLVVQQVAESERLVGVFDPPPIGSVNRGDPRLYKIRRQTFFGPTPVPVNDADGRARGVEIMLDKPWTQDGDRWSGWISYALADADREMFVQGARVSFPFQYDRRHVANVVASFRPHEDWTVGATFRFGSGFPYTPPVWYDPIVAEVADPETGEIIPQLVVDAETGFLRLVPDFGGPENLNSARLEAYHRLDLRVAYRSNLFRSPTEFYLDVINVYNHKNVLRYRYWVEYDERANIPGLPPKYDAYIVRAPIHMLPFLATFGVRVNL